MIFHNFIVFWSTDFIALACCCNTQASCKSSTVFHLERQKDEACAHKYAASLKSVERALVPMSFLSSLVSNFTFEDPVELLNTFKRLNLQVTNECTEDHPRSRRGFHRRRWTMSSRVRHAEHRTRYRAMSRRTRDIIS